MSFIFHASMLPGKGHISGFLWLQLLRLNRVVTEAELGNLAHIILPIPLPPPGEEHIETQQERAVKEGFWTDFQAALALLLEDEFIFSVPEKNGYRVNPDKKPPALIG